MGSERRQRPKALAVKVGAIQSDGPPRVLVERECDSVLVFAVHHDDPEMLKGCRFEAVDVCGPQHRNMVPLELFQVWMGLTSILAKHAGMPDVCRKMLEQSRDSANALLAMGRSVGAVTGEVQVVPAGEVREE